jgi:hypothetical protein
VFKDDAIIDVNRAHALTNQIKLTRVLESLQTVVEGYFPNTDR